MGGAGMVVVGIRYTLYANVSGCKNYQIHKYGHFYTRYTHTDQPRLMLYLTQQDKKPNTMTNQPAITDTANALYLRVSTKKQGISQLGIDAQRSAIAQRGITGVEFMEIETGKNDARPQLALAMAHVRTTGGKLIVASLDRLSRNVAFLFQIKELTDTGGIDVMALDVPEWNTLTVGMFAVIAQHERERISKRTRGAMTEKRARDGEWRQWSHLMDASVALASGTTRRNNAMQNIANINASMPAKYMVRAGMSMRAIANELNTNAFATPKKSGKWSSMQVKRLLSLMDPTVALPTKRGPAPLASGTITLRVPTLAPPVTVGDVPRL